MKRNVFVLLVAALSACTPLTPAAAQAPAREHFAVSFACPNDNHIIVVTPEPDLLIALVLAFTHRVTIEHATRVAIAVDPDHAAEIKHFMRDCVSAELPKT